MIGAWQAFLVALAVALAATPVVRRIALAAKALDHPKDRSVHKQPVPFLGGLAIFAAFTAATLMGLGIGSPAVRGILLGGTFILLFGILDDWVALRPAFKLAGQVAAAGILIAHGVRVDFVTHPFGHGLLWLGDWTVPLTVLWIVAVINVVNLIDGLDGLAAGVSAIAALTLLLAATQQPLEPSMAILLTAALAGAVLGFLPYNFHPARIFMGDGGSMFVGFVLAAVSVEGSLKSPAAMTLAVPVLALGLPILDTVLAILRRWHRRLPIGQADREHFHHRLLQLGLTQREVVLSMYLASGWLGISALAIVNVDAWVALGILAFVLLTLGVAAWKVGMFGRGVAVRPWRARLSRME